MQSLTALVGELGELVVEERRALARAKERFRVMADRFEELLGEAEGGRCPEQSRLPARLAELRDELATLHNELDASWTTHARQRMQAVEQISRRLAHLVDLSALGELSASVAHEIRNPLCGILLTAEVLKTKMDAVDSRVMLVNNLHREAERMEKVVNNLLHFARNQRPRLALCELGAVVMRSIESVRGRLQKEQMEVEVLRSGADCEAEVDADLMQQVFSNLLANAIDACPAGSRLEVHIGDGEPPSTLSVAFRDHGEGIGRDALRRVFDPFFTSKKHGVGLGLSVSKKIVEAHDGRIDVTSEPGRGATFTVVLPRRSKEKEARAAA